LQRRLLLVRLQSLSPRLLGELLQNHQIAHVCGVKDDHIFKLSIVDLAASITPENILHYTIRVIINIRIKFWVMSLYIHSRRSRAFLHRPLAPFVN
jgi:hypothetical protein